MYGEGMAEQSLTELLQLSSTPVAIAFVENAPPGVPHVSATEPASCGYWKRAAAGEVFFTVADDHKRCPVGAHTHHVALSEAEQAELKGLIATMVDLSYLKMDEVAHIARRATAFQGAVYSPLAAAPVPPDVVLVRGNAKQLMLLAEAAQGAGVSGVAPAMGRPTCAVIPEAINSDRTAVSFGCVGNRVYTGATDSEGYFAIPGSHLETVTRRLQIVVNANRALEKFHQARLAGDEVNT
jgi:uncharacterized protein (DUF169 family)